MKLILLGGRPCSGKTTLACRLGELWNMDVIHLDEFARECIDFSTADNPNMYRWKEGGLIELLQKDPGELLNEYINTYEEMLPLLMNKLNTSSRKLAVIEGAMLLPAFIGKFKNSHDVKTCYLLTDDAFVNEKYHEREYVQDMLLKPGGRKAVDNLLERDSLFARYITDEVEKYALPVIFINSYDTMVSALTHLEKFWGLNLAKGQ